MAKKETDVRKSLPKGVNATDMNERGERSGELATYGDPYLSETVLAAMKAWGVRKWWLINPLASTVNGGVPRPGREGGPKYMLLFADGKWRYAAFQGLNGQPCYYCPWEGWEAPNGQAAYTAMSMKKILKRRKDLEAKLAEIADEIEVTENILAAARKQPERGDESW